MCVCVCVDPDYYGLYATQPVFVSQGCCVIQEGDDGSTVYVLEGTKHLGVEVVFIYIRGHFNLAI